MNEPGYATPRQQVFWGPLYWLERAIAAAESWHADEGHPGAWEICDQEPCRLLGVAMGERE